MERYTLFGSNGSPYSLKMRAIMRYRRLPFNWVLRTSRNRSLLADLKPALIPVLRLPEDNSLHLDSTKLIYMLESRHPNDRSILPDNKAHAFLAHLIEDMADEWCTKMMFHYRWTYDADINYASHWIADDGFPDTVGADREEMAQSFAERQIGRMPLVGCTAENLPAIETGYQRILALLDSHVGQHQFLFGTRPSIGDFGLYGQLQVLATDPTPQSIVRAIAQRTESWLRQLDDASGIEGEWLDSDPLPEATKGLIEFAGYVYLPFLAANAQALSKGDETFSLSVLGHPYSQSVFAYQVKCLTDLRNRYQALSQSEKSVVQEVLQSTEGAKILEAS
ncbi:MAG: glutathione S-transferase [Sneathiella sp.]|nr:MAG: glutathione S-transferase [Sneathiella sp.]